MITQLDNFAFDALNNLVLIFLTFTMLKHMLYNIVAKLIFCQSMDFSKDLI